MFSPFDGEITLSIAQLNHTHSPACHPLATVAKAAAVTMNSHPAKHPFQRTLLALRTMFLASCSFAWSVSHATLANNFVATVENAGVQQTQSGFVNARMETFNALTRSSPSNFTTTFPTQVGNEPFTGSVTATVTNGPSWHGKDATGLFSDGLRYGGAGGTGIYPKNDGTTLIELSAPVNYFGLWISAMNDNNVVKIYANLADTTPVLTFTASILNTLVGTYSASNPYYGNPNWQALATIYPSDNYSNSSRPAPTEKFAFVNFYRTTGTFRKIEIEGGGFETDNWTVGTYNRMSGTNPDAANVPNITAGGNNTVNLTSGVGGTVNPVFDGGTLKTASGGVSNTNFTATNLGGTIDANGYALEFSGVISNAAGATGSMGITNTGASGAAITFSGINTYTGSTTVQSNAALNLSGSGSIANSSGLVNNGTFSIAGTNSGASVVSMTGSGATILGSQTLTLTHASGEYSGALSGTGGGITIAAGTHILSGTNSHSGTTTVQAGATLQIPSSAALGTSTLALVGTSTTTATLSTTSTMTISNPISVAYDPTFNVASGTSLTVSTPITDGVASGDVVVEGGGSLVLAAVNTYSGVTKINGVSTLELTGSGSIAHSISITNNANLKIFDATPNVSFTGGFAQSSAASLMMNWNQLLTIGGTVNLSGELNLFNTLGSSYSAGRYTLMATDGVTGAFTNFNHSNLSASFTYALAYDTNHVYLDVISSAQSTLVLAASPSSINVNGTSTLSTTGGSGTGAVSYTLVSGPCTLSASTLTATGVGSCIVTATKAASGSYASATSAQVNVAVSLGTQASLVVAASPSSINVNGTSTLSTTGGSGTGAVSYTLVSGPCTLSASTLTGTGVGICTVSATKASDSVYASATSAQVTVAVTAVAPIPTLSEWAMILMASLMGSLAFVGLRRRP